MPFYPNGTRYNWTSLLHAGNSTVNPLAASINSVGSGPLSWLWPALPYLLYLFLFIAYDTAPSRGKLATIAALVLVLSVVMVGAGMIPDAIINVLIFGMAWLTTWLFKL